MNFSFNPFKKIETPKQEPSPSVPGIEGDLYSDENTIELQKRFGTIDIHKIEEMLAAQEESGAITRIDDNRDADDQEYRPAA